MKEPGQEGARTDESLATRLQDIDIPDYIADINQLDEDLEALGESCARRFVVHS